MLRTVSCPFNRLSKVVGPGQEPCTRERKYQWAQKKKSSWVAYKRCCFPRKNFKDTLTRARPCRQVCYRFYLSSELITTISFLVVRHVFPHARFSMQGRRNSQDIRDSRSLRCLRNSQRED